MARHPSSKDDEIPAGIDLVDPLPVKADEVRPWIVPVFLIAFVFVGTLWIRVDRGVGSGVIVVAALGLVAWAVLRWRGESR